MAKIEDQQDALPGLSTVSDGTNTAGYGYVANSPLVSEIDFTNSTTRRMVTTKGYDFLNRLTNIASVAGSTTVASFKYPYNDANQRVAVTNADGTYIVYSYDNLGQVTAGNKYWSDGTPVAGQQFNYAFDDIGNRTSASFGGDESGANLRTATYGANSLNQYTNRSVPGYVNVMGSANSNATVSIWGSDGSYSATSRKGDYYRGELAVDNTTNALWLTVTNVAVLTNGGGPDIVTNTTGNAFLAQTPEAFVYDLDGNLTVDGRWTNYWNGENRLIQMVCLTNAANGSKLRLIFAYDYQGRRVSKQVETWTGSTWRVTLSNKFLYDGWNLIAELNGTNNAVIRNYLWGTDLSGSPQGAGGVGGLLAVQIADLGVQNFVAFDGNGNVAALVKATDGSIAANYEYGPFGELVKASGLMARANPVRFSTKYQDDESDLVYYGYRYYSASLGRWESRDPMGYTLEDLQEFYEQEKNLYDAITKTVENLENCKPDWCLGVTSPVAYYCGCVKTWRNVEEFANCMCVQIPNDRDCRDRIKSKLGEAVINLGDKILKTKEGIEKALELAKKIEEVKEKFGKVSNPQKKCCAK